MTMPNDHEHAACGEVTDAAFLHDVAARMFRTVTPAMGFDQGDTDRLHRIARDLERQKAIVARVQAAARTIMHAEGEELAMLREKNRGEWVASQTLESERAANAMLTAEVERLRASGQFLLDRLVDHEVRMTSDEDAREWYGHVTPAMERLRALAGEGA